MTEFTKKLTISSSPHIKSPKTVTGIMGDVIISLIPAGIAGVLIFGIRALLVIAVCVASCIAFEYISRKVMKRSVTLGDLSAVVTGLLLAYNLPVSIPLWMCIVGSFVAIVIVKQLFGGIGQNFANPAITARIVMLVSFASAMTNFTQPTLWRYDAVASATPLSELSALDITGDIPSQIKTLANGGNLPELKEMLFGVRAGCIGETCAAALLLGAVYLIARGIISVRIPFAYIATVGVFMLAVSHGSLTFTAYELTAGGLLLGAFYMATDYTTSPMSKKGKVVFGIGCGLLTSVIRLYGSLPEGVSYSILLMNIACPLIEKACRPGYFGQQKTEKKKKEETAA